MSQKQRCEGWTMKKVGRMPYPEPVACRKTSVVEVDGKHYCKDCEPATKLAREMEAQARERRKHEKQRLKSAMEATIPAALSALLTFLDGTEGNMSIDAEMNLIHAGRAYRAAKQKYEEAPE